MVIYATTDIGHRQLNQDAYLAFEGEHFTCLCVADGCGAYDGSELAAKYFLSGFKKFFLALETKLHKNPKKNLILACQQARASMAEKLRAAGKTEACTTFALACTNANRIITVHVGDSRIYRLANSGKIWRSKDHSYVQKLVEAKKITAKEALIHPDANQLLRTVGLNEPLHLEFHYLKPMQANELLLLCSDGFWEHMPRAWLKKCLQLDKEALQNFVNQTLTLFKQQFEGLDNMTLLLYRP